MFRFALPVVEEGDEIIDRLCLVLRTYSRLSVELLIVVCLNPHVNEWTGA